MTDQLQIIASYVPRLLIEQLECSPRDAREPRSDSMPAALLFGDISGFTALTEHMAQQGPQGAEQLSQLLNELFERLIETITAHGGDIVKFAGDALLAMWPCESGALAAATRQAAACSQAIQAMLAAGPVWRDHRLAIRIGVGAGPLTLTHLGGANGRWELLLTGDPIRQVVQAEQSAEPGETVLSRAAWALVAEHCVARPVQQHMRRLEAVRDPLPLPDPRPLALAPQLEPILQGYLPGSVLARITAGQSDWLAELRRVTVLFISLGELGSETSLERAQQIMSTLQRVLYRYEGSVNKLNIDDKGVTLVAAFGLPPLAHEDDAERGVLAAMAIREELCALGLPGAIGIATGRAFCGVVGSATRREYTMLGNVVNLAARLMQVHGDGVLCDQGTYAAVQHAIDFETLPPIPLKGKTELVALYRPLELRRTSAAPQASLVGRDQEQRVVGERLRALAQGLHGGVIVLEGESGIGKSRLLQELRHSARGMGLLCLSGAGDRIESASPYQAWRPILSYLLGLDSGGAARPSTPDALLRHLEIYPELFSMAPLLNVVLPLDIPENDQTLQLSEQEREERTMQLLLRLVGATARLTPTCIMIDDVHWLDASSWRLLLAITQQLSPLLTIVAGRDFSGPLAQHYEQLQRRAGPRRLVLEGLRPEEVQALICQRLGIRTLPGEVVAMIYEQGHGNPLFSEELAYALRDAELLLIEDGECLISPDAADLRTVHLPDTIQGVITNRIDRLLPQQQLTLKVASVLGQFFSLPGLRACYPISTTDEALSADLATLEQLDLVVGGDGGYTFKHGTTREVVYQLMAFAQRRSIHRRAAAHARDVVGDTLRAVRHSYWAQDYDEAAQLLEASYLRLLNQGQALNLRQLLEDLAQQELQLRTEVALSIMRGEIYAFLHDVERARQSFTGALGLLPALGDQQQRTSLKARIYRSLGELLETANPHEALRWLREGLGELGEQDATERGALLIQLGRQLMGFGEYAEAQETLEQGLALLPSEESPHYIVGLVNLGNIFSYQGDARRGKEYSLRALAISQRQHDDARQATNWANLGIDNETLGDWGEALRCYHQALEISDRLHSVKRQASLLLSIGILLTKQGDFAGAERRLGKVIQLMCTHQLREPQIYALNSLADLQLRRGAAAQAEVALREALQLALELDIKTTMPENSTLWAQLELQRGEPTRALEQARGAVELARELGQSIEEGKALRVLGLALAAAGEQHPALAACAHSLKLLADSDPYEAACTRAAWGGLLLAAQQRHEGGALIQLAQETFRQLGASHDLALLDQLVANNAALGPEHPAGDLPGKSITLA